MRNLIKKLSASDSLRGAVKALHLHVLANGFLKMFPVVKTLPGSGLRYRARRLESLVLSVEIFDKEQLYELTQPADRGIQTFVDLGCNTGYFSLWLAHKLGKRDLSGLIIDGNPEAVEDARWHAETNHLDKVKVMQGLVGVPSASGSAEFFVHISNVRSMAAAPQQTGPDSTGWKAIKVPCLNVNENWEKNIPGQRCDLLKMDIEGAELDFIRLEKEFLKKVQVIIAEWHKRQVQFADLQQELVAQGFKLKSILSEEAELGTAVFIR